MGGGKEMHSGVAHKTPRPARSLSTVEKDKGGASKSRLGGKKAVENPGKSAGVGEFVVSHRERTRELAISSKKTNRTGGWIRKHARQQQGPENEGHASSGKSSKKVLLVAGSRAHTSLQFKEG